MTVVMHWDRLVRFGVKQLEAELAVKGRGLVAVGSGEINHDLVRDMICVLTRFCARLYGRGSACNRALREVGYPRKPPDQAAAVGSDVTGGADR